MSLPHAQSPAHRAGKSRRSEGEPDGSVGFFQGRQTSLQLHVGRGDSSADESHFAAARASAATARYGRTNTAQMA